MTNEEFASFSKFLKERSGIVLTRDKEYLLESRLLPIARRHNRNSVPELFRGIATASPDLQKDVIEAMTTNESFFFRDTSVFERLRTDVLPAVVASRAAERKLRIWSAACSSGQELYSVAMLLFEDLKLGADWQLDLIGTDLSNQMVERAREGLYNHFEAQRGLPIRYLKRFFAREGENWRIDQKLRQRASFRPINLLGEFAALGSFDVIFCRNVLIYFDAPTKSTILNRMSRQLRPDGYLFLGGAETVLGVCDRFVPRAGHPGVYVHAGRDAGHRVAV